MLYTLRTPGAYKAETCNIGALISSGLLLRVPLNGWYPRWSEYRGLNNYQYYFGGSLTGPLKGAIIRVPIRGMLQGMAETGPCTTWRRT